MSLYDDAGLISLPTGAAGKDGTLYNIKPVEKLKVDELITNGTFYDNDSEGAWVLLDSPTISNNQAVFYDDTTGTNATKRIYQNDVFEDGKTYKVSFEVVDLKDGRVKVGTGSNTTAITTSNHATKSGNYSFYYTAQVASNLDARIQISRTDSTGPYDFKIDNVSVKEVEQEAKDFTFDRASNLTATRVGPGGLIEKGRENELVYSNQFDTTWTATDVTLSSGQSGYDGSTNAWLVTKTASVNSALKQTFAETLDGVRTFSVYAKSGTLDGINIQARGGGTTHSAQFDLSDGSTGSDASEITSNISPVGNGWYRCSVAFNGSSVDQVRIFVCTDGSTVGFTAGTILIQDAQLENGLVATDYMYSGSVTGKAGILEDEPRFDYTGGGCPGLLIEDQSINLVQYSEYFGDYTVTNTTISDTLETSPEGVKNAYEVLETNATNVTHKFVTTGTHGLESYTSGNSYSVSVFAKEAGRTKFRLKAGTTATAPFAADFTLSGDGTAAAATGNDSNANVSIENYGNGWYRCKIENFTAGATASTRRNIFLLNDSGEDQYDGDDSKGVIFYGYQLEESAFATSYIPNHGAATATRVKDDIDRLEGLNADGLANGYNTTIYCKFKMIYETKSVNGFLFNYTPTASGSSASDPRLLLYASPSGSGNFAVVLQYRVGGAVSANDLVILTHTNSADGYNVGDAVKAIARITDFGITLFVNGTKYTYEDNGQTSGRPFLKSFAGLVPDSIDLAVQDNQRGHELYELITFPKALTDDECIDLTT